MSDRDEAARFIVDGLAYNIELAGGSGPPLVMLHGFTGSAAGWADDAAVFARGHRTIAIDLPGHGETDAPRDLARYQIERVTADLGAILDRLGIGRAHWLGYSLGGRIALHVAVASPERVASLVLVGASAGIDDPHERAARVRSDEELAARIERGGVPAFVAYWERLPLFATQASLPPERRDAVRRRRLAQPAVGLANSLRGMGQGAQTPLSSRLRAVDAPALLIVGEHDAKFRDRAVQMAALLPRARIVVIPGAGHAAHLERPERFRAVVTAFLRRCGGAGSSLRCAAASDALARREEEQRADGLATERRLRGHHLRKG